MKRFFLKFILFPVTVTLMSSCYKEAALTREELRSLEIQKRLDNFTETKIEECHTKTMELAIATVDSILKANAVRYKQDDLERPPLPEKPVRNLRPMPKDSVKNVPFLNERVKNKEPEIPEED